MNVNYIFSLIVVLALFLLAYVGVEAAGLQWLFGVVIPYAAVLIFIGGFISRILSWARSPVPFRIPTVGGQGRSLPWIKPNPIDSPSSSGSVVVRMLLEILLFRSLFRNTRADLVEGDKLAYRLEKWLWLFSLLFHYSFLVVFLRHFRFFLDPVPGCVQLLETLDGFLRIEFVNDAIQVGLPGFYISGLVLLAAATFLLLRRMFSAQVKYISLSSDYFPLFLIMGIAFTGIIMRYFLKTDIVAAKALVMGLVSFHPVFDPALTKSVSGVFYGHLFFVCVLLIYFPFSKLMHLGGIFLSPTRNLPNDTRMNRHVNTWNYPVEVHTYEEYEDEYREKMIEAGLPVEKE